MLTGYGSIAAVDASGKLWIERPSGIQFEVDSKVRDVYGYPFNNPQGFRQVVDSATESLLMSCTISTGSFDKYVLARMFNRALSRQDIVLPYAVNSRVPADAPFEIEIVGLQENQKVGAFIESDVNPIQLTQVSADDDPLPGQYTVSLNSILFNEAQAGSNPIIQYMRPYEQLQVIGYGEAQALGRLSYFGRMIGDRFGPQGSPFYIPAMVPASGFVLGGDESKQTYRLLLVPPYNLPIVFGFGLDDA